MNKTAAEFETCVLIILGNPDVEVSWKKNGEKVKKKKDKRIRMEKDSTTDTYFLEISKVTKEDEGSYTVTAQGAGGEVTHAVKLSVGSTSAGKQPPQITEVPPSVTVGAGDVLTIGVNVSGQYYSQMILDKETY